jgi:hypothetical protein
VLGTEGAQLDLHQEGPAEVSREQEVTRHQLASGRTCISSEDPPRTPNSNNTSGQHACQLIKPHVTFMSAEEGDADSLLQKL